MHLPQCLISTLKIHISIYKDGNSSGCSAERRQRHVDPHPAQCAFRRGRHAVALDPAAQQPALIWDLPTRVFHWSLALSFLGA